MKEKMVRPKKEVVDLGVIERTWEYSSEPRLEGLLQASKYLKWKNINKDYNIFKERIKKENKFNKNIFK